MTSLSPVHWFEYLAAPTHLKIPGKPWKRRETSVEAMVEEATSSSEYRPHHELVKALALATEESKNCKRVLSKLCKVVDDVKEVIRVQKVIPHFRIMEKPKTETFVVERDGKKQCLPKFERIC
uniref:Uncharacterized protein n=1 Tax=Lotharella globosa TaxID=91324 RepID=A0A7S3Y8F7_9EUKA